MADYSVRNRIIGVAVVCFVMIIITIVLSATIQASGDPPATTTTTTTNAPITPTANLTTVAAR